MEPPVSWGDDESQERAKRAIRGGLRTDRAARDARVGRSGQALADVAVAHLGGVTTVALYVSMHHEPATGPLRTRLREAGTRVLLPWLRDDDDLDWVLDETTPATPAGNTTRGDALRPPGKLLGLSAVAAAAVVLLPALAVDTAGRRLGQGGGSYDRVLARLAVTRPRPLLVACVFDEEVRDASTHPLPEQHHDRRVDVALTPTRWLELKVSGR